MANLAGERRLLDYAQPHLAQLVSEFGERAYLSVLQGSDTITILSHQSPRAVQAVGWVGRTTPAYCTSVGKALLLDHSRAELKLVFEGVEFVPLAPNTARGLDDFEAMIDRRAGAGIRDRRRGDGAGTGLGCGPRAGPTGQDRGGTQRVGTQVSVHRRIRPARRSAGNGRRLNWARRCAASGRPTWRKVAERAAQPDGSTPRACASELAIADVPVEVQRRLAWLMFDFAVAVGGGPRPAVGRDCGDYATAVHGGDEATALLRRAPTRGARGGVCQRRARQLAGHRRRTPRHQGPSRRDHHSCGDGGGRKPRRHLRGVPAGRVDRLRGGDPGRNRAPRPRGRLPRLRSVGLARRRSRLRAAVRLGLPTGWATPSTSPSTTHPIADMSRAVTDPAMTKDAVGWGAFMGMSSALLAEAGFTGLRSQGLDALDVASLGDRWQLLDVYVKPYPCCRWSQQALDAAVATSWPARWACDRVGRDPHLRGGRLALHPTARNDRGDAIQHRVAGRGGALRRAVRRSRGDAVRRRRSSRGDRRGHAESVVSIRSWTPNSRRRLSRLVVRTSDGDGFDSGVVEAPGEPGSDGWEDVVSVKAARHLGIAQRLDLASAATTRRTLGSHPRPADRRSHLRIGSMTVTQTTTPLDLETRLRQIEALEPQFRERARGYDDAAAFPEQNFADLRAAGLLALTAPAEYGGDDLWWGTNYEAYYRAIERLARVDSSTAQLLQVHSHALGYIARHATKAQLDQLLAEHRPNGLLLASVGSETNPRAARARRVHLGAGSVRLGVAALVSQILRVAGTGGRPPPDLGCGARRGAIPGPNGHRACPTPRSGGRADRPVGRAGHAPDRELGREGHRPRVAGGAGDRRAGRLGACAIRGRSRSASPPTTSERRRRRLTSCAGSCAQRPYLADSEFVQIAIGDLSADIFAVRSALYEAARAWERRRSGDRRVAFAQGTSSGQAGAARHHQPGIRHLRRSDGISRLPAGADVPRRPHVHPPFPRRDQHPRTWQGDAGRPVLVEGWGRFVGAVTTKRLAARLDLEYDVGVFDRNRHGLGGIRPGLETRSRRWLLQLGSRVRAAIS